MSSVAASLIGGTPIVELTSIFPEIAPHRLFAKCEFGNATGSIKDRAVKHMLANLGGPVRPQRLVEATGGNTGISLALLASSYGYRVSVTMSSKMGPDKVKILQSAGAEVIICPAAAKPGESDHFITRARMLGLEAGSVYVNQFENTANENAHFLTTGPEILQQIGAPDFVILAAGTGGTLNGIARFFAGVSPARTRCILADPAGSILADTFHGRPTASRAYLAEGVGGDFWPPLLSSTLLYDAISVPEQDAARAVRRLRHNGLFVGSSSGINVAGSVSYLTAASQGDSLNAVTILADSGDRYLSTWQDDSWLLQNLQI